MCVAEQGGQDLLLSPWLALPLPGPRGFSSPGEPWAGQCIPPWSFCCSLQPGEATQLQPHPTGPAKPIWPHVQDRGCVCSRDFPEIPHQALTDNSSQRPSPIPVCARGALPGSAHPSCVQPLPGSRAGCPQGGAPQEPARTRSPGQAVVMSLGHWHQPKAMCPSQTQPPPPRAGTSGGPAGPQPPSTPRADPSTAA